MLEFAHYGEERDLNATPEELAIAEFVSGLFDGAELVRVSPSYITVKKGEWDVIRIKYSERARWVKIPVLDPGSAKRRLESVGEIKKFKDDILKALEHIAKYS